MGPTDAWEFSLAAKRVAPRAPLVGLGLEWTHTANGLVVHFAQSVIVEIGWLVAGIVAYLHTRRTRSSATAEYENLSRSKMTGGTS